MRKEQIIPIEIQDQLDIIESQQLVLAEIEIDEIELMPTHRQVLRVRDNNIALSQSYLKITPKRILIDKITGEELDLNLPVINWERTGSDLASLVDEYGERVLVETNYYEDVFDEEGEFVEEILTETTQEPVMTNVLKYLMLMIKSKKYVEIFELFTTQYISDTKEIDINFFKRLQ